MTASTPFPSSVSIDLSPGHDGATSLKNLASNQDHAAASRRWFSQLLWRAFPSRSERELATRAALVLGVSPRQVTNWLREENDASLRYVTAVLAIAGAELVFGKIEVRK